MNHYRWEISVRGYMELRKLIESIEELYDKDTKVEFDLSVKVHSDEIPNLDKLRELFVTRDGIHSVEVTRPYP